MTTASIAHIPIVHNDTTSNSKSNDNFNSKSSNGMKELLFPSSSGNGSSRNARELEEDDKVSASKRRWNNHARPEQQQEQQQQQKQQQQQQQQQAGHEGNFIMSSSDETGEGNHAARKERFYTADDGFGRLPTGGERTRGDDMNNTRARRMSRNETLDKEHKNDNGTMERQSVNSPDKLRKDGHGLKVSTIEESMFHRGILPHDRYHCPPPPPSQDATDTEDADIDLDADDDDDDDDVDFDDDDDDEHFEDPYVYSDDSGSLSDAYFFPQQQDRRPYYIPQQRSSHGYLPHQYYGHYFHHQPQHHGAAPVENGGDDMAPLTSFSSTASFSGLFAGGTSERDSLAYSARSQDLFGIQSPSSSYHSHSRHHHQHSGGSFSGGPASYGSITTLEHGTPLSPHSLPKTLHFPSPRPLSPATHSVSGSTILEDYPTDSDQEAVVLFSSQQHFQHQDPLHQHQQNLHRIRHYEQHQQQQHPFQAPPLYQFQHNNKQSLQQLQYQSNQRAATRKQRKQLKRSLRRQAAYHKHQKQQHKFTRERAVSEIKGKVQEQGTCHDAIFAIFFVLQLVFVMACAVRYGLALMEPVIWDGLFGNPSATSLPSSMTTGSVSATVPEHRTLLGSAPKTAGANSTKNPNVTSPSLSWDDDDMVVGTGGGTNDSMPGVKDYLDAGSTSHDTVSASNSSGTRTKSLLPQPSSLSSSSLLLSQSSSSLPVPQSSSSSSANISTTTGNSTASGNSVLPSTLVAGLPQLSDQQVESLSRFSIDCQNVIKLLVISGIYACVISYLTFGFMLIIARSLIQTILVFSVLLSLIWGIFGITFLDPNGVIAITGFSALCLALGYAITAWNRVPFAATNLYTALCAMRCTADIILVGTGTLALAFLWSMIWAIALIGIVNSVNYDDCIVMDQCYPHTDYIPIYLLLFFSFYWTNMVIKNISRVSVANAVGTWWYSPGEIRPCCSRAVFGAARMKAVITSMGSICFGSLVVLPAQTLVSILSLGYYFVGTQNEREIATPTYSRYGPSRTDFNAKYGNASTKHVYDSDNKLKNNEVNKPSSSSDGNVSNLEDSRNSTKDSIGEHAVGNNSSISAPQSEGADSASSMANALIEPSINKPSLDLTRGNSGGSLLSAASTISTDVEPPQHPFFHGQPSPQLPHFYFGEDPSNSPFFPPRIVRNISGSYYQHGYANSSLSSHRNESDHPASLWERIDRNLRCCNRWSYTYIGMYGYSFAEGGEKAIQLFETREWMDVVRDNLIQNVLLMASVVIGGSTGTFAVLVEEVDGYTFTTLNKPELTAFFIGLVLGFVLSNMLLLGVVGSAVNTILVCFAAGPFEFDKNHPRLSREMREVWSQQVWEPAESPAV